MLYLKAEIKEAIKKTCKDRFGISIEPAVVVPSRSEHGDFSCNISSLFSEVSGLSFDKFAEAILSDLKKREEIFKRVVRVGGYINFFLCDKYLFGQLRHTLEQGNRFGSSDVGCGKRILVEFVSANPTGPLNVVSARAAAVGDVLVKLLNFTGYNADAEFYINDAGRQVKMLGISAEKRYEEMLGKTVEIPEDGYRGEYIKDYIREFADDEKVRTLDEKERIDFFKDYLIEEMVKWQRSSLERFGVKFKNWLSEKTILEKFSIQAVVDYLKSRGEVYEKDGALWFSTTKYGDDKDRVFIKQDGTHTYIVSDASYHKNKFERGYEHLIDILGPDHHGDIMRLKAVVGAFGYNPDALEIIIVQQVTLVSRGEKKKMSKRAGKFITLDSLLKSVNKDAVRFFFLMRKTSAHLDFDVELAKTLSLENPVYYIQYCYARTFNILNFAKEKGIVPVELPDLSLLREEQEREIAKLILGFPEVVLDASVKREIHKLPYYLLSLSKSFHSYYQKNRVVTDNEKLTQARLFLVRVVKQVLKNGFDLIGVSAPERM